MKLCLENDNGDQCSNNGEWYTTSFGWLICFCVVFKGAFLFYFVFCLISLVFAENAIAKRYVGSCRHDSVSASGNGFNHSPLAQNLIWTILIIFRVSLPMTARVTTHWPVTRHALPAPVNVVNGMSYFSTLLRNDLRPDWIDLSHNRWSIRFGRIEASLISDLLWTLETSVQLFFWSHILLLLCLLLYLDSFVSIHENNFFLQHECQPTSSWNPWFKCHKSTYFLWLHCIVYNDIDMVLRFFLF